MPTYREAIIAHTTAESFLAWEAMGSKLGLEDDDMSALIEVNPNHPDVTSATDPILQRLVGVAEMMEDEADDKSTAACSLTIVWKDTRDWVLIECSMCSKLKPVETAVLVEIDEDDPSGEMILVCADCG